MMKALPSLGMKNSLIFLPSLVLEGIFCKFGFWDESLPVVVPNRLNVECTLLLTMSVDSPSIYVDLNFSISR